jgi:hypothetical protein
MNLIEIMGAQGAPTGKAAEVMALLEQVQKVNSMLDTLRYERETFEEVPEAVTLLAEHKKGLLSQLKQVVM